MFIIRTSFKSLIRQPLITTLLLISMTVMTLSLLVAMSVLNAEWQLPLSIPEILPITRLAGGKSKTLPTDLVERVPSITLLFGVWSHIATIAPESRRRTKR
jgi:hypothetical protein